MPAQKNYWHVHNNATGNNIFIDQQDYQNFISYLKEYINPPQHPSELKQEFTINGRTYEGTPHQVKNYLNKIELIDYSLNPKGFDIILIEKEPGQLKNFMRSLLTRYSMNFNKKYQRTGPLFNRPYKSYSLTSTAELNQLCKQIHLKSNASPIPNPQNTNSETDTVKISTPSYLTSELKNTTKADKKQLATFPEIALLSILFLFLFGIGFRNVRAANFEVNNIAVAPSATPLIVAENTIPSSNEVKTLGVKDEITSSINRIKISNKESIWVNIYTSTDELSPVINQTQNGDTYEYTSLNSGWYEIILPNGQMGYVLADLVEVIINE